MDELLKLLGESMNDRLYQMTAGGPRKKGGELRVRIRPILLRGRLSFQMERFCGSQVFHRNLTDREAVSAMAEVMERFRQLDVDTTDFHATVLMNKKGEAVIRKRTKGEPDQVKRQVPGHDRKKNYILEEGQPVPFLIDLGVQTPDGKIVRSRYDKFRQVNRFLEFIADIVPILPGGRCIRIVDFGCGKSYLTFAMYYYLHVKCGLDIRVTGLDLKKEVIMHCSALAEKYGFTGLDFQQGDIAGYEGGDQADMVVTLHACDTATDYALHRAVGWGAKVILSVPCCQHEMNAQIACNVLQPALKYGLIRERMSALLTDALRANLLEEAGYEVQVLEFIDMEHTPKNILIRAIKKENARPTDTKAAEMADFLHVNTCLQKLMAGVG